MTSARTNLGPLTTPFTYPASCSVVVQMCSSCGIAWQGQACGSNTLNTQGVEDNTACWPPRANPSLTTGFAFNGWGFYSPGIECPVGYATSCVATGSVAGGFPFQFSLLRSETAIGCCPTGYICHYAPGVDQAQTCYSVISTGSFPTVQCSSGTSNRYSFEQIPATITDGSSELVLPAVTIYAPMFQLNRQATDLPLSTSGAITTTGSSNSNSGGGSGSGATTNPALPSDAPPSPSTTSNPSTGLSAGAQAGIGIAGAVVGLSLVGAVIFYLLRRRRRAPAAAEVTERAPPPEYYSPVKQPRAEEMHAGDQLNEAPADSVPRAELP